MSTHKSTARKRADRVVLADPESLVRFAELLKLRSLAASTQVGHLRVLLRLCARAGGEIAGLDEAQVRAHVLHLKEHRAYSPSSIRTAVAALRAYYGLHLGRDWKLFDLVRSPDPLRLPQVLTRTEVARLFSVVRTERFRVVLRVIYGCGLRVGEAVNLEVGDLLGGLRVRIRQAKGSKDRYVPLPEWLLAELRLWWKTHRHPRWIFPGVGRGWRAGTAGAAQLATAVEPMSVPSIQHCMRLAVAAAQLPQGTCLHTLRHSYATHLLDAGVSIRLISAYLGHASLETTLIYTHLTAANEAGARAVLEQLRPPTA